MLRTLLGGTDLIDLSSFVSGSHQGVRLIGASDGTHSGNSVAIIGDFDADGTKDFVIGAPQMGNKGAAFIILGAARKIDTSSFTSGSGGMKIVGANFGDQLGYSVGAAGDVNDDGYDDCMCGAPGAGTLLKPNAGIVYMIFGKGGPYSDLVLSSFSTGSAGFSIVGGAAGNQLGFCTSCLRGALGDVNGDGVADFAVGSANADYASRNEAGHGVHHLWQGFYGSRHQYRLSKQSSGERNKDRRGCGWGPRRFCDQRHRRRKRRRCPRPGYRLH
jgi:hypothetical protein